MKKIIAVLLCFCMMSGLVAYADVTTTATKKEYELWTQSPTITCGMTTQELMIYKALAQNELELYPLKKFGPNYYLAICSYDKTNGGYKGNSDTSDLYLYTLYTTDTGFIIISASASENEYYWDSGYSFIDISTKVDASFYDANGSEVPCYILNPKNKYTNLNIDEYDEYFYITDSAIIYKTYEESEYGTEGYPFIKDKILYRGQDMYVKSSRYYNYYLENGLTKASNIKPYFFKDGEISYGDATLVALNEMTSENGYSMYKEGFASNVSIQTPSSATNWSVKRMSSTFPDGRYVKLSWTSMGSGLFELWYNIYNSDGTLRASGPTGYSGYYQYSMDTPSLTAWVINDSKFIACMYSMQNSFLKEYYRVAVVEESETGEVSGKVELGEKNITPPTDADTEIIQSRIDFSSSDLPIGYNIKDNVINSDKLDMFLRDQVNSIRLNDILILAKEGYQSGEQNTGITLSSYSEYDDSFGASSVKIYTNGQYFRWYCNNPEELVPGTYSKVYEIGDKKVYVTFKIVEPPSNDGLTMVVF